MNFNVILFSVSAKMSMYGNHSLHEENFYRTIRYKNCDLSSLDLLEIELPDEWVKCGIAVHKPKMVYVAFLLLTVSTLAVHGKPTGGSDDCVKIGEWTYCQKPNHYPQSDIDKSIAETKKNSLNPLMMGAHLMKKRDLFEESSVEGNCAMDIIPSFTPYTMTNGKKTTYIVQSKLFNQSFPVVKCSGKYEIEDTEGNDVCHECFKDFIPDESVLNTKCKQRTITIKLYIYNNTIEKLEEIPVQIGSDCFCAKIETKKK